MELARLAVRPMSEAIGPTNGWSFASAVRSPRLVVAASRPARTCIFDIPGRRHCLVKSRLATAIAPLYCGRSPLGDMRKIKSFGADSALSFSQFSGDGRDRFEGLSSATGPLGIADFNGEGLRRGKGAGSGDARWTGRRGRGEPLFTPCRDWLLGKTAGLGGYSCLGDRRSTQLRHLSDVVCRRLLAPLLLCR